MTEANKPREIDQDYAELAESFLKLQKENYSLKQDLAAKDAQIKKFREALDDIANETHEISDRLAWEGRKLVLTRSANIARAALEECK